MAWAAAFCAAAAVVGAADRAAPTGVTWVVVQDDDGEHESHWGTAMAPGQRICKLLELGISPEQVRAARIGYVVAFAPYHSRTRKHLDAPEDGAALANVVVTLNGTAVARRPGIELVSKGTHLIEVPTELLRQGENRVEIGWEPLGDDAPTDASYGYFYVGIDTDRTTRRSSATADGGKTWSADVLRAGAEPDPRWRGEYLIRLHVALPNGDPEEEAKP